MNVAMTSMEMMLGHLYIYIQGSKRVSVQLDCSRSSNAVVSRESSVHVLEVMPNSIIVSLHN